MREVKDQPAGRRDARSGVDDLLWSDLALALGKAERMVTRRLERVLSEHNCTVERWRALTFLADGSSHSMSALTDSAVLPPPGVTRLVDGMVADNLVYRKADPGDRRRVLVHITARGRDLHRVLLGRLAEEQDVVFAGIDEAAVERLIQVLRDLTADLG